MFSGPAEWGGVALMPGLAGDADLHLYEVGAGAKGGFSGSLETSSWGVGESEYVLVLTVTCRTFDAGVVNVNDGTEGYTIQTAGSEPHVLPPSGSLGSFTLDGQKLFGLHEVVLPVGVYHVRLLNTGNEPVDLGLSVHSPDEVVQSKSEALAASWLNGPGEDEELDFTVFEAGTHDFPVWRVSGADLQVAGEYEIEIMSSTTQVPGGVTPTLTRLAQAKPNPFFASATLSFDLAEEEHITLEVYGPNGARVRTLAQGRWGVGRHEVVWAGDGDGGRRMPAGVYFVRLKAGERQMSTKVIKAR
jgi:hypothetical protein